MVFANKQDLLSAADADEITKALNLAGITGRTWQIQACSAKSGDGLQEGMEFLVNEINTAAGATA